ncbi:MAG: type II secretion system F family protein [Bacillota bacterium]
MYAAAGAALLTTFCVATTFRLALGGKRIRTLERLHSLQIEDLREDEEDILKRPLLDRTVGAFLRSIITAIGQATPGKVLGAVEERLERAGNPNNVKPNAFLASSAIRAAIVLAAVLGLLRVMGLPASRATTLAVSSGSIAGYLPWLRLSRQAGRRQTEIRRSLPDIMDLLIVSVEAGLTFDMALLRVVDKFKGTVSDEFGRALREMQLGKSRKDALKDTADRVGVHELGLMVNAVVQAEQLGVGISQVLQLQSDLMRDKRQQAVEEQAMKAPVKMLFPMVFFIFPAILIVILGPAVLNILAILSGVGGPVP